MKRGRNLASTSILPPIGPRAVSGDRSHEDLPDIKVHMAAMASYTSPLNPTSSGKMEALKNTWQNIPEDNIRPPIYSPSPQSRHMDAYDYRSLSPDENEGDTYPMITVDNCDEHYRPSPKNDGNHSDSSGYFQRSRSSQSLVVPSPLLHKRVRSGKMVHLQENGNCVSLRSSRSEGNIYEAVTQETGRISPLNLESASRSRMSPVPSYGPPRSRSLQRTDKNRRAGTPSPSPVLSRSEKLISLDANKNRWFQYAILVYIYIWSDKVTIKCKNAHVSLYLYPNYASSYQIYEFLNTVSMCNNNVTTCIFVNILLLLDIIMNCSVFVH